MAIIHLGRFYVRIAIRTSESGLLRFIRYTASTVAVNCACITNGMKMSLLYRTVRKHDMMKNQNNWHNPMREVMLSFPHHLI